MLNKLDWNQPNAMVQCDCISKICRNFQQKKEIKLNLYPLQVDEKLTNEKTKKKQLCTHSLQNAPFLLCKNRLAQRHLRSICFSCTFFADWIPFNLLASSFCRNRHCLMIFSWTKETWYWRIRLKIEQHKIFHKILYDFNKEFVKKLIIFQKSATNVYLEFSSTFHQIFGSYLWGCFACFVWLSPETVQLLPYHGRNIIKICIIQWFYLCKMKHFNCGENYCAHFC